jgi:hypothetical protein
MQYFSRQRGMEGIGREGERERVHRKVAVGCFTEPGKS